MYIKFHRIAEGSTPTGGYQMGHIYFIASSNGTGVLKVCTDSSGTLETYSTDIVTSISSGSTDSEVPSAKCVYDNLGVKVVSQTSSSVSISSNVLNLWGEVSSLTITLATPENSNIVNEYMIQFTSPSSSATTFSYPSTITWAETNATAVSGDVIVPSIEKGKTYQISIVNNNGVIGGF